MELPAEAVDLGEGFWYDPIRDDDTNIIGIVVHHPAKNGGDCHGPVFFDVPASRGYIPEKSRWRILSPEPLSLLEAVCCAKCSTRGWIRLNRWVPVRP